MSSCKWKASDIDDEYAMIVELLNIFSIRHGFADNDMANINKTIYIYFAVFNKSMPTGSS